SVRHDQDGSVHSGHFTQEQVKEIVAYANERFVDVIPEIELPGHALAALSAYPQYACTGGPFKHRQVWGVEPDVFCAGNDATFEFLENILDEVIPLFTSKYVHIGGDECPKSRWEKCPKCRARMRAEGLKSTAELQSYFVRRIEKHINSLGKQIIGWDEILEGGIDPSATIMSWQGLEGGIHGARAGHDVIMSPSPWLYLDKYQGAPEVEPMSIGGYLTLEKTYSFDPMPEELTPEEGKHIIGLQGNIWTEYMYEPGAPEYFIYPRILAVAEIGWSPASRKDYSDFERRVDNAYVRLDGHGINYHVPMPEGPLSDYMAFTDTLKLAFTNTRNYPMVYTLDGTVPGAGSARYADTLRFTDNDTLKIATL
ncbi:MAG: family 20 glycosylhydrolase, partial [Rikenellaceae bacterium]|nr:family 20 glycosylhydrolase [Rikenellaceae bacterium]